MTTPRPEWRPISEAPKDGTVVLTYWGPHLPVFAAVMPDRKTWRVMMLGRNGDFVVHGNYAPFEPTHWMPLPPPPGTK